MNKFYIYFFLFTFFQGPVLGDDRLMSKGTLFESSYKNYDKYEVITSKILYQEKDNEEFTKGYRPDSTYSSAGAISSKTIDFPKQYSSTEIYEQMRSYYANRGYDFLFECTGNECGDVAGWKLYLSNLIGGLNESQYYFVAQSPYQSEFEKSVLVFHVSELDGEPRVTLDEIVGSQAKNIFSSYSYESITKDDRLKLMHEFFFERGNSSDFKNDNLDNLVSELKLSKDSEEIVLIGYADSSGNETNNLALSLKRANTIKEYFISEINLSGNKIVTIAGGEVGASVSDSSMGLFRKVSVYLYSP